MTSTHRAVHEQHEIATRAQQQVVRRSWVPTPVLVWPRRGHIRRASWYYSSPSIVASITLGLTLPERGIAVMPYLGDVAPKQ